MRRAEGRAPPLRGRAEGAWRGEWDGDEGGGGRGGKGRGRDGKGGFGSVRLREERRGGDGRGTWDVGRKAERTADLEGGVSERGGVFFTRG